MADVISLLASVVTIATVVIEGFKHAKTFYQASEDFRTLQASNTLGTLEQVEHFTNLVKEINDQHAVSLSTVITTSLSRAKLTLEELNQLIRVKLLKNVNGTSRVRRRAWTRNRSKVYKVQAALKEHRVNLSAAISANSLSSNIRSEATMISISRDVGHCKETSSSLDRQLFEIQQSVSKTHHAILSQTTTVNSILQSISPGAGVQLCSTEQRSSRPWRVNRGFQKSFADSDGSQSGQHSSSIQFLPDHAGRDERGHEHKPVLEGSTGCAHVSSGSMIYPEPTSLFEVSRNFLPETYTTDQLLPKSCLVAISSLEIESLSDSKTNPYRLFYRRSRQWCRINISIEIHRSSVYWMATKTSPEAYNTLETLNTIGAAPLPLSLLTKFQDVLLETKGFDEDETLRFSLSDQDSIQEQQHKSVVDLFPTASEASKACQEILASLDDLGCPRYLEGEITQIEMLVPPSRFAACINGMLVYETRFASSVPSPGLLYNIQLLHCMNDVSGYAKLVGIVVDNTRKHLKSYLIEFPRARWKLEQVAQIPSIPWKRREKWARQLVEGVSQVHSKGFVVGTLNLSRSTVLIDSSDCVQFWCFRNKLKTGDEVDYYPPEFRHLRDVSSSTIEAQCPNVTSKTDIFYLGKILWLLAEDSPRKQYNPICIVEGYNAQVGIALPSLPENIPQYYRNIIDACRAKNPNDRLAAWKLLELFPSTSESESSHIEASKPESQELSVLGKGLIGFVHCDHCREDNIQLPFFHCNVCAAGNYDICRACYEAGIHCYDREHFLVEMRKIGSWIVPGKYQSSVMSSGDRDFIEL